MLLEELNMEDAMAYARKEEGVAICIEEGRKKIKKIIKPLDQK